jgi:hypothetical protein
MVLGIPAGDVDKAVISTTLEGNCHIEDGERIVLCHERGLPILNERWQGQVAGNCRMLAVAVQTRDLYVIGAMLGLEVAFKYTTL